jgi:FlaA1/EpsC-like NDP-sugar epimerase
MRVPVIIYGAGNKGVELARSLIQQGDFEPVAFIDDEKSVQKRIINSVYVYAPRALAELLKDTNAKQVLVAVSSDDADNRKRIINFLEPYAVHVRLIPNISDIVSGRQNIANIRDVGVEDLLGRDQVDPLPHLLENSVCQRNVVVTGAGGSIGSELCRQIVKQAPRTLLLLDQSEFSLYSIHREMRELIDQEGLVVNVVAVLGSVTDSTLLRRTFTRYQIETVYHAAAYKHVSLVESNVIQGLKNNTFGTLYAAEAAVDTGVKNFILISTDKAVRTTNVMGASKRLAEMVLQAMQQQTPTTCFSMVRFGNVLGSSGSVVPLFLEQIEGGGPVTVTHPEVTRYFMSIPEAAQLVLQAASMAEGGDVFLLDMGKPVKILDLAKKMIRLKGYTLRDEESPDGDIEIRFTGLKPGEKLYEELLVGGAASGTQHRKILRAEENYVAWAKLRASLNTLEQACDSYDYGAIKAFIEGLIEGSDLAAQLGDLTTTAEVVAIRQPDSGL